MNDIVKRLRGSDDFICDEAADEIEHLRAVCRDQAGVELSEENDRLIVEIERLNGKILELQTALQNIHEHALMGQDDAAEGFMKIVGMASAALKTCADR